MTVLPQPAPSAAAQWVFDDYDQGYEQSLPAAADGTCQATFGPVPENQLWLLQRVAISCTSVAASSCSVYLDYVDPGHLVDHSASGNTDVADGDPPIVVVTGTLIIVAWSGADPGAVGTARAQWAVLRRSTS